MNKSNIKVWSIPFFNVFHLILILCSLSICVHSLKHTLKNHMPLQPNALWGISVTHYLWVYGTPKGQIVLYFGNIITILLIINWIEKVTMVHVILLGIHSFPGIARNKKVLCYPKLKQNTSLRIVIMRMLFGWNNNWVIMELIFKLSW